MRRVKIRRVGPCEMVEIDGGARTAAGGSLLLVDAFLQLQLAAPAWPPTLAAHFEAASLPAFRLPSRLD